jgi:5-formyltetrahydrofolate cyclo-ligase
LLAARRVRPGRDEQDTSVRAAAAHLAAGQAVVAAYVPLPGEPGGPGLPEALTRVCDRLLLPIVLPDRDLDWAAYDGALVDSALRIREPAGPRLSPPALATADLVLVPALAVDRSGVRLGRGGGSYDRVLHRVRPDVLVTALLYDGELIDRLPAEPHDHRVRAVITPKGLIVL